MVPTQTPSSRAFLVSVPLQLNEESSRYWRSNKVDFWIFRLRWLDFVTQCNLQNLPKLFGCYSLFRGNALPDTRKTFPAKFLGNCTCEWRVPSANEQDYKLKRTISEIFPVLSLLNRELIRENPSIDWLRHHFPPFETTFSHQLTLGRASRYLSTYSAAGLIIFA